MEKKAEQAIRDHAAEHTPETKGLALTEVIAKELVEHGQDELLEKSKEIAVETLTDVFSNSLKPAAFEVGTGSIFGVSAGMFSRLAARFAFLSFGGFFVGMQLLQSTGYVNVEWSKIQTDFEAKLDLNNDGKIDEKDAKIAYERYIRTLTFKMPSTAGFAAAFLFGLKGKFLR